MHYHSFYTSEMIPIPNSKPGKEDEWPTENLAKKLALAKVINYAYHDKPQEERGSSIKFGRGGFHSKTDEDFL